MKCPIDQTEMEKGIILNPQTWKKANPMGTRILEAISLGGKYIYAYRCAKCGKIELKTEENN